MIKKLISKYKKCLFEPNLLSFLFNPFWIARRSIYKEMKKIATSNRFENILDVGCGTKPYMELFDTDKYIGLEYDSERSRLTSKADFFYTNNLFPFRSEEFDLLICNQVLEHVFEPDLFLKEINRVLKKDGKIILSVPFCWDEHEQPYDYARYTSFGVKHLIEKNGFQVEKQVKLTVGFSCLTQILTGNLFKTFSPKTNSRVSRLCFVVCIFFIISPLNMIGFLLSKLIRFSDDLFLDNLIVAKK